MRSFRGEGRFGGAASIFRVEGFRVLGFRVLGFRDVRQTRLQVHMLPSFGPSNHRRFGGTEFTVGLLG